MKTQTYCPLIRRVKDVLNPIFDKKYGRSLLDYVLAVMFCQHNARVIADFEDRMSSVIYDATGGRMSKPYYEKAAMSAGIADAFQRTYEEGYKDGKEDGATVDQQLT